LADVRHRIDYYFSNEQNEQHSNVDRTELIEQNLFLNRAKYAATAHCAIILPTTCILQRGTNGKHTLRDKRAACHLLTKWNELYENSRVILVHSDDKQLNSVRDAILDLDLSFPVYYAVERDWLDIAFLQYTHSIDFSRSIYVVQDEKNAPPTQIMRFIKLNKLMELFNQVEQDSQQQIASEEEMDVDAINDYIRQQL
jgi:hypothetical protein